MFPIVVSADHSAAGGVDCHSAVGTVDAEGIDHNSTDWVVPGNSARSLAEGWCADEYCF